MHDKQLVNLHRSLQVQETHNVSESPDSKLLDVLEQAFSKGGGLGELQLQRLVGDGRDDI